MSRTLTSRERRLLWLCVGVLLFMGTVLLASDFMRRRTDVLKQIASLEAQVSENQVWLNDRAFWEKRRAWLSEHLPTTESLGRAQGQMLEELQNQALEREIKVQQQTLIAPTSTADYQEIAVNLRLRGDQTQMLNWLLTMQSPEKFQCIKQLELELDSRAKEPTPQALCNLTLARWFKPESGS